MLLVCAATAHAGPNRYGHSDRVERHMLPSVTTGPLDPAWSPDGRWIAFSMRGDIWKVPAEGGTAVALTSGPNYHFEPAWSPDGNRIALTVDTNGNLDIGVVSAQGGAVQRITSHRQVDVQPAWSRDGHSIYFASARAGGFRIFRHDLNSGVDTMVVAGFQPSVSPDGKQLAFVASVQGRLGTGGLWVRDLPAGEPKLVHYEETEYRMKPSWTPDGLAFLYVSDEMGSNDVAVVPAAGGNPIVLTADARDEYSPSLSPDGRRFAFISNRSGPMVLYTAPIGGGPLSSWQEVPLRARTPRAATGRVRVRVLGPDGQLMPARIYLLGSDGRGYTPDGGFHRVIAATETHYFHTQGEFEVEVPAGRTQIDALRGYEYKPAVTTVDVPAGGERSVTLQLNRLVDLPARGWYSGDTHVHDLHQGNFGLTHRTMFDQALAEDLHVTNTLIHMDGTRLMGRWEDLTGKPHPLSTPTHILQYGEEFRGGLGHIGMIGIRQYVLPFTSGSGNTPYAQHELDFPYLDGARAQGGLAGFMHPYLQRINEPGDAAGSLIPIDIALGKGDFYDVGTLYSDEVVSAQMYYRFLNCGFRVAATSGSDNFSDVYRDPPPGADRAYVRVEGPLTMASWLDGIRKQRTFGSTGPLLFLDVAGKGMGDELVLAADAPAKLRVKVEAVSIAPLDSLQIIVNGKTVRNVPARDSLRIVFDDDVEVAQGGWVAARVLGPSSKYVTDSYAFAQTTPVYVLRAGKQFRSADDGKFLVEVVNAIAARTERSRWRTPAERDRFMTALDSARSVYQRCATPAS
ncbi:MAG: CehA/McbA family metallohydrolase [Longimicrobiales bacterium]